jgi:hypothetical protein
MGNGPRSPAIVHRFSQIFIHILILSESICVYLWTTYAKYRCDDCDELFTRQGEQILGLNFSQ